jgi:curved DNA-binding protein CbpA
MDYYQILEVPLTASEAELKKSFLRLAKRYHPDVYRGPNKDHFKKVLEAHATLKHAAKRADYDKHARIKHMKGSKEYQDFERRRRQEGKDFSHEAYEEMRRQAGQNRTVREAVDPEFEAAFRKLNLNRLFQEFNARPMRSSPEELHE